MQQPSNYRFAVTIAREVILRKGGMVAQVDRESFFDWLWQERATQGLVGVDEGTVLSEQAAQLGLEAETWTIDAAEAPRSRDWVSGQAEQRASLYFDTRKNAEESRVWLNQIAENCAPGLIEEVVAQDWDAEWKASFQGAEIPPFWKIVPPWEATISLPSPLVRLVVNPGAGFGTGTHETTQLCLQAMGEDIAAGQLSLREKSVLDFGSGSGILGIGAALLGAASVLGVEIDPLANDNARENATLNEVSDRVQFAETLPPSLPAPALIFANILKPVLLEFCSELCRLRKEGGATLILSGLIEKDIEPVSLAYAAQIGRAPDRILRLNDWRALVWNS